MLYLSVSISVIFSAFERNEMAKVEPGKGRSSIETPPGELRITIPSKKNYFIIIFLLFWLAGWFLGETNAIKEVFTPKVKEPELFIIIWLGGWTVGGIYAILAWLWNVAGKEVITLTSNELKHARRLLGLSISKEYDLNSIKNLRVSPIHHSMFGSRNGMEFWGFTGGAIAFDYGHTTPKFGALLEEAEAAYIVEAIKNRVQHI